MGVWQDSVESVKDALRDVYEGPDNDYDMDIDSAIESEIPIYYGDIAEYASDNVDILLFDSELGYSSAHDIIQEAIGTLLREEANDYLSELEDEWVTCEVCGTGYFPDASNADDPDYCSQMCQADAEAEEAEEEEDDTSFLRVIE